MFFDDLLGALAKFDGYSLNGFRMGEECAGLNRVSLIYRKKDCLGCCR